jgi:hypothetical protein
MPRSGAVYDDRGYLEGRDPRTMSPDELVAMGHTPMSPLRAIRTHCLDCCAGSSQEVAKCMAERCPSWPYRMGTNPWRGRPSDEQRQAMRERGRRLAEANRSLASDAEDRGGFPPLPTRRRALKIGRLPPPRFEQGGSDVVRDIDRACVPEKRHAERAQRAILEKPTQEVPNCMTLRSRNRPLRMGSNPCWEPSFRRTATSDAGAGSPARQGK